MSRELHVCVVTQQLNKVLSGPGLHARNLINHLLRDGHQVSVIAPESERPSTKLPYEFIGIPATVLQSQARWMPLAFHFGRALVHLTRRDRFDIVQFTDARESLFCPAHLASVGNINDTYAADIQPLGYYRKHYTDWTKRWTYYHFVRIVERFALRRLQAVIANSHYTATVIRTRYGIIDERLHVCHKSVEADHFTPALKMRSNIAPHPPRILFVGGNMQRKGLPTLIEAAPHVIRAIPEAEFWIVGRDTAQPDMEALCRQRGVRHAFRFFGLQTQDMLPKLYAQCDIFAMPSLTEAFGVVFLEAMAAGLPVVGTRVGGIVEIVNDGENGILIQPNEVASLASAIINLLKNKELRERLVNAGLTTAKSFSVERMMTCTYEVYRAVLARMASSTI